MLLRTLRRAARPAGALAALAAASAVQSPAAARAQYYGGYDPCNPCQTVCQTVCQQTAMVVQPCYQTVPVTEYQQVKQTVMRPVVETKYVDQQVTEYRPVTETKTAEIPVTTYQPVTEMQAVCQDRSYWATQYVPNCRLSPCQYDPRPGLLGWMNRTGYEIRSAFTPRYTAHRYYVPNQVVAQVPVTRHVAQHGTRQVTYNVTRYEPHTTTRQVAVNETKWVAEEQTVTKPVVAYRTVPVGTTVAYAPVGSAVAFGGGGIISNVAYGEIRYNNGGTATAFGPSPDPISAKSATKVPSRSRSAEATPEPGKPSSQEFKRQSTPPAADDDFGDLPGGSSSAPRLPKFKKFTAADRERILNARRLAKAGVTPADEPKGLAATHEAFKPAADETSSEPALAAAFERPATSVPFAVRSVRWTRPTPTGPELVAPSLASAE
ncbi:MAG TPA: hypothetical protein VF170_09675 [Planctomycetaceae bacterium]